MSQSRNTESFEESAKSPSDSPPTQVVLHPDVHDKPVLPYDYNPSAWAQRIPIAILAFVAAIITTYMALYQWDFVPVMWDPIFGDQSGKVLKSKLAHDMFLWIGIHDAAMGTIAYLGDAILGLAGSTRRWQYRPWMVVLFGIDVIPLGIISSVLVACQAFVVGSWCFLCLVTAVISLILVYWAWDEVRVSLTYMWRIWKQSHQFSMVWDAFWGRRRPEFEAVAAGMIAKEPK